MRKFLPPTPVVVQRLLDQAPLDCLFNGQPAEAFLRHHHALAGSGCDISGCLNRAGLLLMIPTFQMIVSRPAPVFPRRIAERPLPVRHLAALMQRAVPVLRYLEKAIRPLFQSRGNQAPRRGRHRAAKHIIVVFAPIP